MFHDEKETHRCDLCKFFENFNHLFMTYVLLVVSVGYFNTHYVIIMSLLLPIKMKLFRDIGRFLDMLLLKFCEYAYKTDGNID